MYRMVWHNAARWNGASDQARADTVLRWLGSLETSTLSLFMGDTFQPDRAESHRSNLPVPGYNRPGTERWAWHINFLRASCAALGGDAILNTGQARPLEQSYRWVKDREFLARECRAMAKAALQLRENRHVQQ